MTLPVLKQSYCKVDEILLHYERYTLLAYRTTTRSLYAATLKRWLNHVDNPLAPSLNSIYAWLRARRTAVSVSTINSELAALRAFYCWLHKWAYVSEDYGLRFPRSKRPPRRLPRYLSVEEVARLLAAPALSTLVGFRDHVMMCVAYDTGIRASELIRLAIGDVLDDKVIFVAAGKGGADRYVPITDRSYLLIQEWINVRRKTRPGKSSTLFVTSHGKPFSQGRAVWEIVDRYARAALGVGRGFERIARASKQASWSGQYPHLLRASFATHLHKNGCDLRAIQELLGHASIETTAHYIGMDWEKLRAEHAKLHSK